MSALFKGYAGIVMRASEPQFDAETGAKWVDVTYQGSSQATSGIIVDLEAQGVSYRTMQEGPVYTLSARIPIAIGTDVPPDRYEISTVTQNKSLFELPLIAADAADFDMQLNQGELSYRARVEQAVEEIKEAPITGFATNAEARVSRFRSLVRHLRKGTTGFEFDFISLKKFRKVSHELARATGKFNLNASRIIYSTGQLNLPNYVAFALPATPEASTTDFEWGWKRLGQRVSYDADFAEQAIDLAFGPWSTLAYSRASGPLGW